MHLASFHLRRDRHSAGCVSLERRHDHARMPRMGVAVVGLRGERRSARGTAATFHYAGLRDLIADSPHEYARFAPNWPRTRASDPPPRAATRPVALDHLRRASLHAPVEETYRSVCGAGLRSEASQRRRETCCPSDTADEARSRFEVLLRLVAFACEFFARRSRQARRRTNRSRQNVLR